MIKQLPVTSSDDSTSYAIDITQYDTHGLCSNYTLRRHNHESISNVGTHQAHEDWQQRIGRINPSQFGGANPRNGNFTALVLPLIKPERVQLTAYVLEYAFLYDNVVELQRGRGKDKNNGDCKRKDIHLGDPRLGMKKMQADILDQLNAINSVGTRRVERVWKEMVATTMREQDKCFGSLKEYVDFRIVDAGALFVEAMMLWGMDMELTPDEDERLAPIVKPCYAALGLANDYFSFDWEYAEFKYQTAAYITSCSLREDADTFTNSVWLMMRWTNTDIVGAKDIIRGATAEYEAEFLTRCDGFLQGLGQGEVDEKLKIYLRALQYQVPGNMVWSVNCPRYHPAFRYDANAGLEDMLTEKYREDAVQPSSAYRATKEV
ncbi:isoprenoid synthase domain-containing protein [Dendryphion nanum]|uniref:Isoprenoid synthase domain-containing protein n=1 Tax=Dendryphion nanum TaxID=256645 RepID=A0A9P9ILJ6_9PLEO|nr:isoprenoid synthase domain-containing protein [Dendryphion nanum]